MFDFTELVFRNLISHLDEGTQYHLRLAVRRLNEQKGVIVSMHKRIAALESSVESNSSKIGSVQATTAASVAAVALTAKNLSERMDDNVNSIEKKHKNEIHALQKSIAQLSSQISDIDQRVTRMASLPRPPAQQGGDASAGGRRSGSG